MTIYPVLLLPLVAMVVLILLLLFSSGKKIPNKFGNRKRRKIWLSWLAIFMLLFATVFTLVSPIQGMNSLVQGVFTTLVVMVPAIVFHLLASLHYGTTSNGLSRWGGSEESEGKWFESAGSDFQIIGNNSSSQAETKPAMTTAQPGRASSTAISLPADAPDHRSSTAIPVPTNFSHESSGSAIRLWQQSSPAHRPQANVVGSASRSATPEVQEQLSQVSSLVRSHNIGGDQGLYDDVDLPVTDNSMRESPQAVLNQSVDISDSMALSAMSTQQISTLLSSLKEQKGKLQKLVIAQHAVIESEREANIRNRGLARDAIKLMHGARKSQKMAEKMVRRERTERQRLELEYNRVSVALNNAMSILSSRSDSPNSI